MLYRGKKTYKNTVKIRGVNCGFFLVNRLNRDKRYGKRHLTTRRMEFLHIFGIQTIN